MNLAEPASNPNDHGLARWPAIIKALHLIRRFRLGGDDRRVDHVL